MSKFYWTTDGMEKIKQSKIQSMKIGKKVVEERISTMELPNGITHTRKRPLVIEYMVFTVINNKMYDKPIADGMESEEEAHAWINQNFK